MHASYVSLPNIMDNMASFFICYINAQSIWYIYFFNLCHSPIKPK